MSPLYNSWRIYTIKKIRHIYQLFHGSSSIHGIDHFWLYSISSNGKLSCDYIWTTDFFNWLLFSPQSNPKPTFNSYTKCVKEPFRLLVKRKDILFLFSLYFRKLKQKRYQTWSFNSFEFRLRILVYWIFPQKWKSYNSHLQFWSMLKKYFKFQ